MDPNVSIKLCVLGWKLACFQDFNLPASILSKTFVISIPKDMIKNYCTPFRIHIAGEAMKDLFFFSRLVSYGGFSVTRLDYTGA